MKTVDIENLLARHAFPIRRYLLVPRIAWGLRGVGHECDLLALSAAGVLHEIEIKVSRSDLLADKRKRHTHQSDHIRRLWFAVPEKMREFALQHIPAEAGLIACSAGRNPCVVVRRPVVRRGNKMRDGMALEIARLGVLRYWSLRFKTAKWGLS